MTARSEKKILGSLLHEIRSLYPEVWHELKYQTQYGPEFSDFPYFPAALELESSAQTAIRGLTSQDKEVLVENWNSKPRLIELKSPDEILDRYGTILLDYIISIAKSAGAKTDFDN